MSFGVSRVSAHLENPKEQHWNAVKKLMKYLKGSLNYGILFKSQGDGPVSYSDADFAGDEETRRSTTGYVIMNANGPVTWGSRKQKTVALSTTEAEYIAGSEASQEVAWFKLLFKEITNKEIIVPLYIDNNSAVKLIKNTEIHRRTKHIDVKYHYIRYKVEDKTIAIFDIDTDNQLADILTKVLSKSKHCNLRARIGIVKLN